LHGAQSDFERFRLAANLLEKLDGETLASSQGTGRKNRQMGRKWVAAGLRMQVRAQVLDELSCRALHIAHQRVSRVLPTGEKLYRDDSQRAIGQTTGSFSSKVF